MAADVLSLLATGGTYLDRDAITAKEVNGIARGKRQEEEVEDWKMGVVTLKDVVKVQRRRRNTNLLLFVSHMVSSSFLSGRMYHHTVLDQSCNYVDPIVSLGFLPPTLSPLLTRQKVPSTARVAC